MQKKPQFDDEIKPYVRRNTATFGMRDQIVAGEGSASSRSISVVVEVDAELGVADGAVEGGGVAVGVVEGGAAESAAVEEGGAAESAAVAVSA